MLNFEFNAMSAREPMTLNGHFNVSGADDVDLSEAAPSSAPNSEPMSAEPTTLNGHINVIGADDVDLSAAAPSSAPNLSRSAEPRFKPLPPPFHATLVVLSVYFEGTANTLKPITTQIGVFFELTNSVDVTLPSTTLPAAPTALKMGFDGCGVVAGLAGVIWAVGLRSQCTTVATRVRTLLKAWPNAPLVINVLGLSRGGIAALMLAQELEKLEAAQKARFRLNLCLYDPVPGNLVWTAQFLDPLGATTANGVIDVSSCACLRRVLAIYPHEPLADLAFHAPLLPLFPPWCDVEEDATLGCHQGAFYAPMTMMHYKPALVGACILSFLRVHSYMVRCGTSLRPVPPSVLGDLDCLADDEGATAGSPRRRVGTDLRRPSWRRGLEAEAIGIMEQALKAACPTRRVAHQRATPGNIVRHSAGRFLNRHHLELVARAALISQPSAELSERLAHGLRGLAGSAGSAASPSKGARAVTSALASADASADESLTDAPADFLPEATNVADDDTPLFMLQVLRGAAEERRSVRASRLVVSTIVAAVNVAKPPACVPCVPTALRLIGLPTSLNLLCGMYLVANELRNGRPAWIRHRSAGLATGMLASIYWEPARSVWALRVSGSSSSLAQPAASPLSPTSAVVLVSSLHLDRVQSQHAHATPIGPWTVGASVLVEVGEEDDDLT